MIFDAATLARGWLSVALASGADDAVPALFRTLCLEEFSTGLRLVATDSYILLRAWVPGAHAEEFVPEPTDDEAPVSTTVVIDPHGRAKALLAHLLKLTSAKDALPEEVQLNAAASFDDDPVPSLAGLEARWVTMEHPDHERLRLQTYEGAYPNWRKVLAGFESKKTSAIALNPELLGRLVKLEKFHAGAPLRWRFGGENRMALVEVPSEPFVSGAAMPVRWDFDRNAPAEDEKKEEAPAGTDASTKPAAG